MKNLSRENGKKNGITYAIFDESKLLSRLPETSVSPCTAILADGTILTSSAHKNIVETNFSDDGFNRKILSTVGIDSSSVMNEQFMEMAEKISTNVEQRILGYYTNGSKVFAYLENKESHILGGEKFEVYTVLSNCHANIKPFAFTIKGIEQACSNGVTLINTKEHKTKKKSKFADISTWLSSEILENYFKLEKVDIYFNELAQISMNSKQVDSFAKAFITGEKYGTFMSRKDTEISTRFENVIGSFMESFETENARLHDKNDGSSNVWALHNAATHFVTHKLTTDMTPKSIELYTPFGMVGKLQNYDARANSLALELHSKKFA